MTQKELNTGINSRHYQTRKVWEYTKAVETAMSSGRHASNGLKQAIGGLAGALAMVLNDMIAADPEHLAATKKALDQIVVAAGVDNPFVLQAQREVA